MDAGYIIMTDKTKKIIERLKKKTDFDSKTRMPSIADIAEMLDDLEIKYYMRSKTNIVENKTRGRRYVNSRHDGKKGMLLEVHNLTLDTSDSYYSFNTWNYAGQLLRIIGKHNDFTN